MEPLDDTRCQLAACLLPLLDLTSLGEDDTPGKIEALCRRVRAGAIAPAAVCVYPEHVTTARRALEGSSVKVATVVNFPDGASDASRALRETRRAIAAGADEIDMVLPWAAFVRGDEASARAVVDAVRGGCGIRHTLKLILETGELTPERIRAAAQLGIDAGVDFLKTSTGKAAVHATPEAAAIMLDVIAANRGRCGFKAAGGIRNLDAAIEYLDLARARLGDDWIAPEQFRIGASTLYDELAALVASPT
ncbi:MAG: deoxyribose-phosphate aldolase [Xanthomonadaceae bacterium]|nr:deoxyribose-phosphate aldolase [Xanthomonadaceae bacterium]MDE1960179.1 deoxyribose-phosphate aldolase [Xanthomonadaceae bacterium]MDE2084197.1 deoxyribose-phosphate aldolase [Xanthomonadaceae bacterium]